MNWTSQDTSYFLNPKWPAKDLEVLKKLAEEFPLHAHLWVPSSGSSASNLQSVKMIALSKKAFLESAEAVNKHLQCDRKDIWAQVLPGFHVGGLGILARTYLSGAQIVDGLSGQNWDANHFIKILREKSVTLTALVPAQVFDLIQTGQKPPDSLRAVVVGGAALAHELYVQATDLGWPLLPSFGMTECCSQVATAELGSWRKKQADLHLLSHIEAEVDESGFLKIRSPSLLTGFAQLKNGQPQWLDPKQNGWLLTEDKAKLEVTFNGRILQPLGRSSDFIKILGEGVDLKQLQEKLENLVRKNFPELLSEFVVLDVPDARRGHELLLVASAQVQSENLLRIQKDFSEVVAPYERFSQAISVNQIPRTALGKLEREKLKAHVLTELKRKLE